MSDITLITVGDIIFVVLMAGSPGALIGAVAGARRAPTARILGAVFGGVLGFLVSLALAFGALIVFWK